MPATPTPIQSADPAVFRSVMGHFTTGVTVVSYLRDGQAAGMTANAFMSVSLAPLLVMVSVRKQSLFTNAVGLGDLYGVNILCESQEDLSAHFGGRRDETLEIPFFDDFGFPLLHGSLAHVIARVVDIHPAGDHLLYIGEVQHVSHGEPCPPLVYFSSKYKQIQVHQPSVQWHSQHGW